VINGAAVGESRESDRRTGEKRPRKAYPV